MSSALICIVRQEYADVRATDDAGTAAHLQIARLSEALIVARTMMMEGDLQAMDRMIELTRELDRYHGFAGVERPSRAEQGRLAGPTPPPLALAAPGLSPEGNGAASD